jgi:thioredoxin-dependent peroxiredoxin
MQAPDFNLPDQDGNMHSLKDYAGGWLVLYIYLKDETPGCTTQACDMRDARQQLASLGNVQVVGLSKDSAESHKAFADKHGLGFTLLSDPEHKVIEAYGAWDPATKLGTLRNTYIISPKGELVRTYKNVEPTAHANQIMTDLQALRAGA